MNARRAVSGLYGGAMVAVAIWLDSRGHKLESQILVLTAFALAVPVALAVISDTYRKHFVLLFSIVGALHALLLWSIRRSLPLRTPGIAILSASAEAVVLVFVVVGVWPSSE